MENPNCVPEGALLDTEENRARIASPAALRQVMEEGAVVEGVALRCGEDRSLEVELGALRGVIPREEGALGIREGKTRDVAILSRVGKPVCVKIIGYRGDTPILSRRLAQEEAQEHFLTTLRPGRIISARVTHLERFGAFVDMGRGVVSFLGLETISVSRISHANQRFAVRQQLPAAVLRVDPEQKRIYLTHRELMGTWMENADRFAAGTAVRGIVRTVEPYGAFIELAPNLSGLAEQKDGLRPGMAVSVYIKSIQSARMKIKLAVLDVLEEDGSRPIRPEEYLITSGRLSHWQYSPPDCEGRIIETWF